MGAILIMAGVASAQNWIQTSAPSLNWVSIASSADGNKLVAVNSPGPIYTSTNSGVDWNQVELQGQKWTSVASSADGAKLVATSCLYANTIQTSSDSGATWIQQTNAPTLFWYAVASSADGARLVAVEGGGGIYTSTNSGVDWISNNVPLLPWCAVASSADGTKLVAVAEANGIYTSTNSGKDWINQTNALPHYWKSVASSADGSKLIAGAIASYIPRAPVSIYTSHDFGVTWVSNNIMSSHWLSVASSADGTKLAASDGSQIYTSTNFGATWTSNNLPIYYYTSIATSADGCKLAVVVTAGGIFTSQTTSSPLLNLSLSPPNCSLAWTIPSTNFGLQQSSDLAAWADVTNSPVLNLTNIQNQVTLCSSNSSSFYRLKTR